MGVFGTSKMKLFGGSEKIKKAYLGTEKIYSAGNIVTYYVDSGIYYQEEVDSDASCLNPTTFTPSKSGWMFVGWREDTTASGDVLSSKIMGDELITLYAVFKKAVTLTYYDNTTTARYAYGDVYYNNTNQKNASWLMKQSSKSGWTVRGWGISTAGNASVAYNDNTAVSISENTTIYGLYQKTCTLTAKSYNSTQTAKGTAYYNCAGNTTTATLYVPTGASYSGWTWRGWSSWNSGTGADASVQFSNGQHIDIGDVDRTIYGLYYQNITLSYKVNGSTSSKTGTRYYNAYGNTLNPTFTISNPTLSGATFKGWSTSSGSASISYSSINGTTFTSNTTIYAVFKYNDNTIYSTAWSKTSYSFDVPAYSGTLLSNNSLSNYSQASFTVVGRMWCTPNYNDYIGSNPTIYVTVNGNEKTLLTNGSDILGASHGVKSNSLPYTVSLNGSLNITLRTKSGVWAAHGLSYDEDGNVDGEGWAGMTYECPQFAVTLTGKTIVG